MNILYVNLIKDKSVFFLTNEGQITESIVNRIVDELKVTNLIPDTDLLLYQQLQLKIVQPVYLYLELPRSSMIVDSVEPAPNIILDIDKNNVVMGVEIIPIAQPLKPENVRAGTTQIMSHAERQAFWENQGII